MVTLITLGVTLIALGVYNFDRPIKVTPSVTKVNIIVINKKPISVSSFLGQKNMGKCVNKEQKNKVFLCFYL